uniref:Putative endopolygalacturonase D n=1 Tax=Anthurium amnicola TaxID=1678845 RepID=A0A1D1YJ45_9ARAE
MSTQEITSRPESWKMAEEGGGKCTVHSYASGRSAAWAACCGLLLLILLLGITAHVLYLHYSPPKPRFDVVSAAVYQLNATTGAGTYVAGTMRFTVAIRNRDERSSVSYDRLSAFVMSRGEAITPHVPLPALWQPKGSTVWVSPVLGGGPVPVSWEAVGGLVADRAYGAVALRLVVTGWVRYKSAPLHGAWRHLFVRCDLLVGLRRGVYGQVPLLGAPSCSVDT